MKCTLMTLAAAAALGLSATATADTTQLGDDRWAVDEGVEFLIANLGSSHFVFNWSDDSGDFTNVNDATFVLTAGETYIFRRITPNHPFVITDDTLPVTGEDGSYQRTTTDGTEIDNATLKPIEDFTADPAPTDDFIEWTPTDDDIGVFYYTCRVATHTGMTGRFEIVAASCIGDFNGDGEVNTLDVLAFLNAWTAADPSADINEDGEINTLDVLAFLNAWTAGC